jgi:hypothetical protein
MSASLGDRIRGAYGLKLPDVPEAASLLLPAEASWLTWRLQHRPVVLESLPDHEVLTQDRALLKLSGRGLVEIERASHSSTLLLPERPADMEIVHPYLSLTAAVSARWRGWNCFHAGGLLVDGGVWGVLGARGAGKSSCLASCSIETRAEVLCDDILVVDSERSGIAGPRCLDLRGDAALRFGVGEAIGVVGARERWRMPLAPTMSSAPLRGWIQLAWGDEIAIQPVGPSDRFAAIARNLALRLLPPNAESLLKLVDLPVLRFSRPRSYDQIGSASEQLLAALSASPHQQSGRAGSAKRIP